MREAVAAKLEELFVSHPLKRPVRLEWRPYRVSAGIAYFGPNAIGLSSLLIKTPETAIETLVHEYAHLLAYDRAGRRGRGHGQIWRRAMADLGAEPTVHHCHPVERNRRLQEVGYLCKKCGKVLVRARRLPARKRFVHARCGGDLQFAFVRAASADNAVR